MLCTLAARGGPSSPSSLGEGSVMALVVVVLVAPAPLALAAFIVTLAVVATMFLATKIILCKTLCNFAKLFV